MTEQLDTPILEISGDASANELSAAEAQAVLQRRAQQLAREVEQTQDDSGARRFVEFQLSGERYGIEAAFVREVHPLRELTPLPGAPTFLLGIVNIRSSILPVINLKKFFGLPDVGLSDLNKIVIIQNPDTRAPMQLGILADVIRGMRTVSDDAIQTSLSILDGVRADYFQGVFRGENDERFILLDMAAILADERILINQT